MPRLRALPTWLALASLATLVHASISFAQPAREKGDWSFSLGFLSEPTPSILSALGSYHVTPELRIDAGVGGGFSMDIILADIEWTTYGAALTYLFSPERPFTPTLGAGLHYVRLEHTSLLLSFFGVEPEVQKTVTLSLSAGFDWQARSGFLVGFGGAGWVELNDTVLRDIGGMPYVRAGWRF